jgi:hypothetical protein
MSVKFSLSLFDDDDLKRFEDMFARAMTRAVVSALKIASRDGLLLRPETVVRAVTPDVTEFVVRKVVEPEAAPVTEPPSEPEPRVPVFLKPPPDNPFPRGKAVEPPPLMREKKTRKLYQELYRTVAIRPHGYVTIQEACAFLAGGADGAKFSGPVSTWLQKGELEACIVAGEKPPTKGLPGKLMISKESLIARDQRRRSNRNLSARYRQSGEVLTTA